MDRFWLRVQLLVVIVIVVVFTTFWLTTGQTPCDLIRCGLVTPICTLNNCQP